MERTSVAARFVESQGPGIHPALDVPAQYDGTWKVFVPRRDYRSWEPMKENVDDLKHAMEEYRQKRGDKDPLDVTTYTWVDVVKQLDAARLKSDEDQKKGLGRCRAMWHKFGKSVKMEDVDPWLDLIPDEYGLSVIRASIVLVFKAARHSADKVEKIHNATIEIVDTVSLVCPKAKIYGSNQSIDKAVRELYVAVLDSVATIVRHLRGTDKKSILQRVRGTKDNTHGSDNEKVPDIEQSIELVRSRAKNFEGLYRMLRDELHYDTWARVQEMSTDMQESRSEDKRSHQQLLEAIEQRKLFEDKLLEEQQRTNKLLEAVSQQQMEMRGLKQQMEMRGLQGMNGLLQFLNDHHAAQEAMQAWNQLLEPSRQQPIRSITPTPRSLAIITVDELCKVLGISPRLANDDLEIIIGDRASFDEKAQAVAQSLLDYTEFRDWLVGTGSQTLLVNGSDEEHATDSISAMSILAVDIMSTLTKAEHGRPVAVLHFFCGLHSKAEEGPKFMMKALILQLLSLLHSHRRLNLEFIDSEAYVVELQNANSDFLLHTIQLLCRQLPPHLTVYCVIDGVSFYESRWLHFHDEMVGFIYTLRQVMLASRMPNALDHGNFYDAYGSGSPRYNLKVLLTSANGTIFDDHMHRCISLSGGDVGSGLTGEAAVEDCLAHME